MTVDKIVTAKGDIVLPRLADAEGEGFLLLVQAAAIESPAGAAVCSS